MAWYGPDCELMTPTGIDGFVMDDFRSGAAFETAIIADAGATSLAQLLRMRPAKFVHALSLTMCSART
jgi:hypothetical protein